MTVERRYPSAASGSRIRPPARCTWIRRTIVARKHLGEQLAPDEPGADAHLLENEEHAEVLRALRQLPDRQREVLVLRYWQHLSEAEIAAAMGISTGTVKSTASRGLAALKKSMGGAR